MAQADSVDEIRHATADDQAERDGKHGMPGAGAREEVEHPRDGKTREQNHERRRAREETEGDSRVRDVVNRERPHDVYLVVQVEAARHDGLRELVSTERG